MFLLLLISVTLFLISNFKDVWKWKTKKMWCNHIIHLSEERNQLHVKNIFLTWNNLCSATSCSQINWNWTCSALRYQSYCWLSCLSFELEITRKSQMSFSEWNISREARKWDISIDDCRYWKQLPNWCSPPLPKSSSWSYHH